MFHTATVLGELIAEAVRRIDAGEPPLVLGIHANGAGHALVPFKYEVVGDQVHLFVYDCNWPSDAGRYINVNRTTGQWDYTLWDGEYWEAADSAISWSTYEDISAVSDNMSSSRSPDTAAAQSNASPVLKCSDAYILAEDASGRRTGYVGQSMVNEIPGALPEFPDPTAATRLTRCFRFTSATPQRLTVNPLVAGAWSFAYSDSDSSVSVQTTGTPGSLDRVWINASADVVSVDSASPSKRVSIWVGTWANGGRVKYGMVDATTTAGDLSLSATTVQARIENHSSDQKIVALAAIGDGWVGRKASAVAIPAGGYVTFSVSDTAAVGASSIEASINGASQVVVPSAAFGTSRSVLLPVLGLVSYGQAFKVRVQTAEAALPATQARVEVSCDSGKTWSSLGSFSSRDADGLLVKSVSLIRNARLRVRVLSSAQRQGSVTPAQSVAARVSLSNPVAPTYAYVKRAFTAYGYLKPRHTAGSYPARIYKYRYVSGSWKSYGYVSAKASNFYSYTKYSRSISLPYKGRWRLRAYAPADAGHAATWSGGYDYITVK